MTVVMIECAYSGQVTVSTLVDRAIVVQQRWLGIPTVAGTRPLRLVSMLPGEGALLQAEIPGDHKFSARRV